MSESTNLMPFFCKWLGAHSTHSDLKYFETKERLGDHIIQHDISSCKISIPGDSIYICPWKGCNKHHSNTIKLKEHLYRHIQQQKPFKCPICNHSRFGSPDALNQHLIIKHNGSVVDPNTDDDDTSYDEIEELNLGKVEYKNDVHLKKEAGKDEKDVIIPTTKLSYRDALIKEKTEDKNVLHVKKEAGKDDKDEIISSAKFSYRNALVKGKVEDKKNVALRYGTAVRKEVSKDKTIPMNNTSILSYSDFVVKDTEDFMSKNYEHEQAAWDLICKGLEAISLLPEREVEYYDLDNENYDDWPDAPREVLTEAEEDELMWKAFRTAYKGSKAVEYFDKAFEILENRS